LTAVGGSNLVEIRENGVYNGDTTYTASDMFRIQIVGSQIFYKKNGVTLVSHNVANFVYPYHTDVVLLSLGARVANATMSTPQLPAGPLAPTNFSGQAISSTAINLTWSDNSTDESGFVLERSLAGLNNWSAVVTTGANISTQTDTGLQPSTAYDYRLHATNSDGDSPTVSVLNIATPATDPTPTPSPSPTPTPSPSPPPAGSFDIFWTDLSNSAATGSSLEKTGSSELEDARGRSVNRVYGGNGFVEFQFPNQGLSAVGFNTGAPALVRADLEFAFSTNGGNVVEIREGGAYGGDTTYTATDVFRIEISGNQVLYKKNGLTFHTTNASLSYPYRVEATLITPGIKIANARISTSSSPQLANRLGDLTQAAALDSVTFVASPFPLNNDHNFSSDHRTRILLFVVNFELGPKEDFHNVVNVTVKNQQGTVFILPVDNVNKVPGFDWLTCIVARLDEQIVDVGTLNVNVTLRGVATDPLTIVTRP
jgi:hypothetical protein